MTDGRRRTWVGSGFDVDIALVSRGVDDGEVGVELSTSLTRHPPSRSLSRQSIAAVQLGAVLKPFRTPPPRLL